MVEVKGSVDPAKPYENIKNSQQDKEIRKRIEK